MPLQQGRRVHCPRAGAADPLDGEVILFQQPVQHTPRKRPMRPAALQREIDGFGDVMAGMEITYRDPSQHAMQTCRKL